MSKPGAEILVADFDAKPLEGGKRSLHVVPKFASEEAALAWYNDPEYEPVRKIRFDPCTNHAMAIAQAFVPPES